MDPFGHEGEKQQDLGGFTFEGSVQAAPPTNDAGFDFSAALGGDAGYAPPMGNENFTAPANGTMGEAPSAFDQPVSAPLGGGADPFQGMPLTSEPTSHGPMIPEMTKLREWEDAHQRELEQKETKESQDKIELRKEAESELSDWYKERRETISKKLAANRAEEETLEASKRGVVPSANIWERVVDLIDTNSRAADAERDISRMRTLLIQLKAAPPPAA